VQAGKITSKGVDLDINADLGHRIRVLLNYGYTVPKFDQFEQDGDDFSGNLPRFAQKHALNAWITKSWASGFTASLGARYVGPFFTNDANTVRLGGFTTFSGAFGYWQEKWDWSINAENLFNRQRYFLPSDYTNQVYPGAPINVFTTFKLHFR
jgi:iron complex outermembrane receptor protein